MFYVLIIFNKLAQFFFQKFFQKAKTISGPTVKVILKSPPINPILEISPNFGSSLKTENKEVERQTQNLVIFSNRETYDKIFTHKKPIPPHKVKIIISTFGPLKNIFSGALCNNRKTGPVSNPGQYTVLRYGCL